MVGFGLGQGILFHMELVLFEKGFSVPRTIDHQLRRTMLVFATGIYIREIRREKNIIY